MRPVVVAGWLLGVLVGTGGPVRAQQVASPATGVELKENLPNPFFPSTTIPFELHPEVCARGHQPTVTLKIYNVLAQVVAIPALAGRPRSRLDGRRLRCGEYRAIWNGRYDSDQRAAAPGVYYYQLTVDGRRYTRKMIMQEG